MKDLYAIVGVSKLKTAGNISGVLAHMFRTRETPNSDGRENITLIAPPSFDEIMAEINSYMPRKNAVRGVDLFLGASPEHFAGKSPEQVKEWADASLQWACKKFGRENIKAAVLHLDECQTGSPHVQIFLIPQINHKLNCRFFTGGRERMRALWTEYAAAMRPFGLKRGREFSPAKHKQIKEFYSDVKRGIELAAGREFSPEELPPPTMGDHLDPAGYAVKLVNRVVTHYRKQNGNLRAALEATRRELEQVTNRAAAAGQQYQQLKENPDLIRNLQEALAAEARATAAERGKYKMLQEAVADFFRRNIAKNSVLRKPEQLGQLQDFPELQPDIKISLMPDARQRQGMELTRGL